MKATARAGIASEPKLDAAIPLAAPPQIFSEPKTLEGWALASRARTEERASEDLCSILPGVSLTRGAGRAYGDAALPAPGAHATTACSLRARRILGFDREQGIVRVQAGVTVGQLVERVLPLGWFLPVTPGTSFASIGGLVAADAHGKNHQIAGSIGRHLEGLRLYTGGGRIVDASRFENRDLFHAVQGGLGLIAHILEVSLRLEKVPSPWLETRSIRVPDLDALLACVEAAGEEWPFYLAWADTSAGGRRFGRGIVSCGRWAQGADAPAGVPPSGIRTLRSLPLPRGVVNRLTTRAVNAARYRLAPNTRARVEEPYSFFYPLERYAHLNRVYGASGFVHHHCVLPPDGRLVQRYLELFQRIGGACWLCAIKRFGPAGEGPLSFPFDGYSVVVEFPARGDRARSMVDSLNEFIVGAGGRIYLVKDALSRSEHVRTMYPRLAELEETRRRWDPDLRIRSALSARVLGDASG